METAIHLEVSAAREGRHPRLVTHLASGWVIFGERQFVRGYLLLLPDPVVPSLNALPMNERSQFLLDASRVGDALLRRTDAVRINYAILGNQEPALHAHIMPRYANEPENLRTQHPWAYDWSSAPRFDSERDRALMESLREQLTR